MDTKVVSDNIRHNTYKPPAFNREDTMAEMALEQTLDLGDYLAAFRRRRGLILLIAGIIFIIGLIAASVWPPTYLSSATILIEEQEIPNELIQSTVTSFAAQRIQVISQRVMARSNLLKIVEEYNLYEEDLQRDTTEVVLAKMRDDIGIDMITAEVVDPRTGRPASEPRHRPRCARSGPVCRTRP
jgi:succinoglycan biosynthesis transport protein ExoP